MINGQIIPAPATKKGLYVSYGPFSFRAVTKTVTIFSFQISSCLPSPLLEFYFFYSAPRYYITHKCFVITDRANIQDYHVLMPIPNREIEISEGSLVQNTGYGNE